MVFCPFLQAACVKFSIADTAIRMAAFLAQYAHESSELTRMEENLNYSANRLVAVWPSRFKGEIGKNMATALARKPREIAEYVYGGRMGNRPRGSGDGWRYRGRAGGVTGRENYRKLGRKLNLPLEERPDLVAEPETACLATALYFAENGCNELADAGNFLRISQVVNGGPNSKPTFKPIGLADREKYYERAKKAFGVPA